LPIHPSEAMQRQQWAARPPHALRASILAAGLGKRLEPLTRFLRPKPLFPLGGKSAIAELWLRRVAEAGIRDVTMNVCVLADAMRAHFGTGARYGTQLAYVQEREPSGTLGGVCKQVFGPAARVLPGEASIDAPAPFTGSTVLVPSGDIVTNLDAALLEELVEIHRTRGAALTLLVTPIPPDRRKDFGTAVVPQPEKRSGLLSLAGRVARFAEKDPNSPSLLNNASVYLIDRELLQQLERRRTRIDAPAPFYDFGKHVFPALLDETRDTELGGGKYPVFAVQYDGMWFDVGNKRDYLAVHRSLLDGAVDVPPAYEPVPWGQLGSDVAMDLDRVEIHAPVLIGHGCRIEPGATLGPYAVIGDGWTVRSGARIRDSVLWERYPFHTRDGRVLSVEERTGVDPHEVGAVEVRQSIVAGGRLDVDVIEKTAQVLEDGTLELLSIDWVPEGPRA
jgi:mannose-1-phosphate guanylyltransferase / phosphomannomutase